MISGLWESGVLAGAGENVCHQSGPRGLEFPIPALDADLGSASPPQIVALTINGGNFKMASCQHPRDILVRP